MRAIFSKPQPQERSMKQILFSMIMINALVGAAFAEKCSFENLTAIGKAMQEKPTLGSCQFSEVKLTPSPSDPCKGTLEFKVSDQGEAASAIKLDTTLFSDYSTPDGVDSDYFFDLKTLNPDPNKMTITTVEYTLFQDQQSSIIIRDFSMDPSYKNDVNAACTDIH